MAELDPKYLSELGERAIASIEVNHDREANACDCFCYEVLSLIEEVNRLRVNLAVRDGALHLAQRYKPPLDLVAKIEFYRARGEDAWKEWHHCAEERRRAQEEMVKK